VLDGNVKISHQPVFVLLPNVALHGMVRAWRHDMSLAGTGEDIAAAYSSDEKDEVTRLV
jgi:hypothetical protein